MIRVFLWVCTFIGFIVVWVVGAYFTQNLWLVPLISNRIEPFGLKFHAQEVKWMPEWPLRLHARQIAVEFTDGQEPKDFFRGPEIEVIMEGIPWSDGAWQIRSFRGSFDQIDWAPHRLTKSVVVGGSSSNPSHPGVKKEREPNKFMLVEYELQLTRIVSHSPKAGMPPVVYLMNLKTPMVRGPFTEWGQIQRGIFPMQIPVN